MKSQIEGNLKELLDTSFNYYLFENTNFFSEQLYYQNQNSVEYIYNVARSFIFCNNYRVGYSFLLNLQSKWDDQKKTNSIHYLMGIICLKLRKYVESEGYFKKILRDSNHSSYVPTGIIYYQIGKVFQKQHRVEKAIKYYKLTLKRDYQPLLFCAYLKLCELGVKVKYDLSVYSSNLTQTPTPGNVFNLQNRRSDYGFQNGETPSPIPPLKQPPNIKHRKRWVNYDNNNSTPQNNIQQNGSLFGSNEIMNKRSSPLFFQPPPNLGINQQNKENLDFTKVFELLGLGYYYLCQYECEESIQVFNSLPSKVFTSGWVQSQVCKNYYELEDYFRSSDSFEKVIEIEPWRLKNLEIFSTVLWHLKNNNRLSWLTGHMKSVDTDSKYTLIAIGNSFSLTCDHVSALKYFRKVSSDFPYYTYAITLTGHEYLENDQLDKSEKCFRGAIQIDSRNYNAQYGLGTIYLRQEKYRLAQIHFRKAVEIKKRSSVAWTFLGIVEMKDNRLNDSLKYFERALAISPFNPFSLLKKSEVLIKLKRFKDAIDILESLSKNYSNEPSVFKTMGDCYSEVGEKEKSLTCYQKAIFFKQKEAPLSNDVLENYINI